MSRPISIRLNPETLSSLAVICKEKRIPRARVIQNLITFALEHQRGAERLLGDKKIQQAILEVFTRQDVLGKLVGLFPEQVEAGARQGLVDALKFRGRRSKSKGSVSLM